MQGLPWKLSIENLQRSNRYELWDYRCSPFSLSHSPWQENKTVLHEDFLLHLDDTYINPCWLLNCLLSMTTIHLFFTLFKAVVTAWFPSCCLWASCLDELISLVEEFCDKNSSIKIFLFFSFWEINDVSVSPNINEPQGHWFFFLKINKLKTSFFFFCILSSVFIMFPFQRVRL